MYPAALRPVFTLLKHSVLAWPVWLRVLAVLPVLVLLWLGVLWANQVPAAL